MHSSKCILLLLLLIVKNFHSPCQASFAFKGKVLHNRTGTMKQFSILVDGKPAITNDAGIFETGLASNITHVRVSLNQNNYSVIYPVGGYVPVPRNLDDIPEIIIGTPNENIYLNEYVKLYREIKSKNSVTGDELINLGKQLDSMQKILIALHYTETDLRDAKELQDGKDKYFPEITRSLIAFKNTAFDLKNALKYVSDYAFTNSAALQQLYEALKNYNSSRDLLDRQHLNYEKYINDYWQDEPLKQELHQLTGYALDTMHITKFLPLQDEITQINKFLLDKDNNLKRTIQDNINRALPGLDDAWAKLDRQTKAFLNNFSNSISDLIHIT